jgi:uncharacterized membrane protein
MSESNAQAAVPAEPTLFSALLTPHRSLGGAGFLVLMGLIAGIGFVAGVVFFIVGAWPVIGFLGLDVALVYWAFRVNYLRAAAYEEVTVTPSELRVRKVSHRGKVAEWSLNPVWTRLDRETHEEFGLLRLFLVSRGRKLTVGGFLGPSERETFASALAAAIGEAKRGPTRTLIPPPLAGEGGRANGSAQSAAR